MKRLATSGILLVVPLLVAPSPGCSSSGRAHGGRIGALELSAELLPEWGAGGGRIRLESLEDDVLIEAFEAVLYEDLDGNARPGDGEARKTTRGVSSVPARRVGAVAFTLPAGMTRPRLRISVATNRGPTRLDVFVIAPDEE
jgi:hypothetical protein